jgi:endonuclease-3
LAKAKTKTKKKTMREGPTSTSATAKSGGKSGVAGKTTRSAAKRGKASGSEVTRKQARFRGMDDSKRVRSMIEVLGNEFPDAHCQLNFSSAFELLIATILAAQCTDAMVNRVTPELFSTYPTPQSFIDAPSEELEQAIYKTGFYRNKTKSIKKCCQALVEKHNGEVPSTMDELVALGGVGRKTANCVLGNVFGIPGIVVDTHVRRLANRMGYAAESNPDKIEKDLCEIVPEDEWTHFSHLLADLGRSWCDARKPQCDECPVEHLCPKIMD